MNNLSNPTDFNIWWINQSKTPQYNSQGERDKQHQTKLYYILTDLLSNYSEALSTLSNLKNNAP